MSFWPFSNSLNSNTELQKLLDGINDFGSVAVDYLISDPTLSQELLNEIHSIKGSYNNSNGFQLSQQPQSDADNISVTSSSTDNPNIHNKDSRGAKLVELLIQPHILLGFLDYLERSVEFFHRLNEQDQQEIEKLVNEDPEAVSQVEVVTDELADADVLATDEDGDADSVVNGAHADQSEDDQESEEDRMRRCIQVSADLLCVDLWVISNRIIETPVIINKLWSILHSELLDEASPTVNHLVHILDQLMDSNSIGLLNFIRNQQNLVDTFLEKLEVPLLMDFFLRVIQSDKPDSPTGIIETIYQQDLIPKLIDILKPVPSQFVLGSEVIPNHQLFFRQTAATDFIKAVVAISSNTALAVVVEANVGPNSLTRQLVSKEIVSVMVHDIMLYTYKHSDAPIIQTNKHGINNCVGIVIELIRKNNSDYDLNCGSYSSLLQSSNGENAEINSYVMYQWLKDFEQNPPDSRDPIYLGEMLTIFSDNLGEFAKLMEIEPEIAPHIEEGTPTLGFTRFRISELIAELLHCSNMILINSRKIRTIIEVRDKIRLKQHSRLVRAVNESLMDRKSETISDISTGLGDVSLDDMEAHLKTHIDSETEDSKDLLNGESPDFNQYVESLNISEDSDDEEPTISPDNPFVCAEREATIRDSPCVGDYFKIKLLDSHVLISIISKFTEFPWHNFFHNVVFDLIQQIFNGKLNSYNSFLIANLFKPDYYNLTTIIVKAYKNKFETRPGYLGHLILISEEVVKFTSLYKPDLISPMIVESISSEEWEWFVNEVLLKTREVYNVVLGADPDQSDEAPDQMEDENEDEYENGSSGFGRLDHNKTANSPKRYHLLKSQDDEDEEEENDEAEDLISQMPDVRIQDMSPKPIEEHQHHHVGDDDDEMDEEFSQDGFLENLSESSSDDDDDNEDDSNELRRVKKHNA